MAPRKLSDADKRDVIELYQQPGETTSTIAKRYGVSTSTISRILKTLMPEDEYRALIAQKRSTPADKTSKVAPAPVTAEAAPEKPVRRRARKRSRVMVDEASAGGGSEEGQLELLAVETREEPESAPTTGEDVSEVATELLTDIDNEELDILDGDLGELDDEFDDDNFDDDSELDDEDDEGDVDEATLLGSAVTIMPIADAIFPRTCYLVVDRLSELITHPLKEFADLGTIPADQASAVTLPVFDNHRVARRFSRRNQRIIKVPDGQIITKTSYYLKAKGITHLLIDGNIYSLF